jgi:hypothetical protein
MFEYKAVEGENVYFQKISCGTKVFLSLFLLFFLLTNKNYAANIYSIPGGDGVWGNIGNWSATSGGVSCGCIPVAGDDVFVEGTVGLTAAASPGINFNSLTVQELVDGDNTSLALNTGVTIVVNNGSSSGDLNIIDAAGGGGSPFITLGGTSILSIQGSVIINDGDQIQRDITLNSTSTLKIGIDFDMSAGGAVTFGATSTVDYFGTGAQSILADTYGKLKFSGTGTKTFQSGTVQIKNNTGTCFDPSGASSVVCTGSNIQFTSTGSLQVIPTLPGGSSYDGITIGSSGTKTFANAIINISGALTFSGTNTYVVGSSTINFNGAASPQNVPMRTTLTYNNITLNNSGSTGAVLISNAITSTNVTGSITVESGIFNNGGYAIAGNGGKTFQVNDGATFTLISSTGMPTGFGSTNLEENSTVDFGGNMSQSIPAIDFGNLTFSNTGARIFASSGTIGVAGVLTPGTHAFTVTGSTINFNGTSNQSVPMPVATALYDNIQINCTGGTGATLAAAVNTTNVAGNITVQTGTFNNGGFAIVGNATKAFQVDNGTTFRLTGTSTMPSGFTTTTLGITSTVDYNGSGTQTVAAQNYGHLTSSSTGARTLASSGTIGVASVFTPGTNAFTITGSTFDFNGSGAQTIPAFDYNNLTSSNTGGRVLASSGSIGVAGTFTPFTNTYTITGSTIDFDGTGAQTIPVFQYNNLTSSSSGARTLAAVGTITVAGTFTPGASNAYTVTGSTVDFRGSALQTLSNTFTFNNLSLNNASGLTLAANANLIGVLSIGSGTFTTTGYDFRLISNASGTACIGPISGNFAGNIKMERYTGPTSVESWRCLGFPISSASFADWADDFVTWGFTGSTYPAESFVSIRWYDETIADVLDSGFTAIADVGDYGTITGASGRGYYVYMGDDSAPASTYTVTGAPNKFDQSLTVDFSAAVGEADDGWNLVTNPYPCSIDWDAATDGTHWTKDAIDNAIYIYNSSTGTYSYHLLGTPGLDANGGSRYVASGQAFWVKANSSDVPSLTAREGVKYTGSQPDLLKSDFPNTSSYSSVFKDFPVSKNANITPGRLRLTASGPSGVGDEIFIHFAQGATNNFDGKYDAWKMLNPSVQNFSSVIAGNKDLAINGLPSLTSDVSIPLRLTIPSCSCTATYSIKRDDVLMLPLSSCLVLEDKKTGGMIDLRTNTSYSFTISDTTTAPRFILHISAPVTKKVVNVTCSGGNNGKAIAQGTGTGPWNYEWKNSVGTIVKITTSSSTADTLFNCSPETYSVSVTGATCGTTLDTIVVKAPAMLTVTPSQTNVSCFGNQDGYANATVSGGNIPYSFLWSNGQSTSIATSLPSGNYSLTITDAKGCKSSTSVSITEPALLTAGYTASSYTVDIALGSNVTFTNTSFGASSYKWNFGDGSGIDASLNPTHSYSVVGNYTVILISSNVPCADTAYSSIVVVNSNPTALVGNQSLTSINVAYDNGQVFLLFSLSQETKVNISVYNLIGEVIATQHNLLVKNDRIKLDIPASPSGIYIAVSEMKDAVVSKKIFIPLH